MSPSSGFGAGEDRSLQVFWEDGEHVFCRRGREGTNSDRHTVLAVLPAAEHPTPASLHRLTHEYALKDDLDEAWAVRPLELVRERGQTMLLLEDPGGEPLDRLIGRPMAIARFLRLAIALTAALGRLHERGLVHKDLKPANVLVNAATGQVWLMGFGIASRLPRERQVPEALEVIAGTLAYMAPEQTGRMNRSIDARSDLYALGVTFYQMLTGALPFMAAEPMEWVHCHIARKPIPPDERVNGIPAQLSAIVMKLLAKTAEERYQTAAGVEADLRRCLAEWEAECRIDAFPLGQHDTPDRLLIPEKLYGREREVETLLAAFDRVVTSGAPELVLVSGYSGIGKSSVIQELHKALVPPRGLFASGKFDQYKRNIPYATVAQAFQSLVQQILGKSDAELSHWRAALLEALGPNGQLMVNLVPELALIIGEQPLAPDLSPQDQQARFQLVFRRFLGVFARPEHPLALFLDDLQWLDAATLDLIEHLATHPEVRHLLLIGAYRDNEVTPTHPLMRRLAAIRSAGGRMQEIVLAPLGLDDVGRLIADALHCAPERVAPLARLAHEKTAGNPFFTIQFLTALAEERLLAFDHGAARWSWDLERIHAKGYTDNVVDLMLGKLRRLPAETQAALQQFACLGNSAAISTLAMVHDGGEERLHAALWAAVRAGLVLRQGATYQFLHDRVQEAAYALIPEGERAAQHLRTGRLLAAHTPPEALAEHVFEIVSQLNRSAALITSAEERARVAELNLIAGQRARASTAYAAALTYLIAGTAMLGEDCWERRYDLTFPLELARAECEFLTGGLAEAEARLADLARRAASLPDLAAVARLQADLFTTLGRFDGVVEVGLDYLRHIGIAWSAHPTKEEVRHEYEQMWRRLGERPIEALLDLPRMADPGVCGTIDVLTAVVPAASYTDENLLCLVVGRMANFSLQHGNSDGSCFAYAWLGTVLGTRFGDYRAGFRFGKLGLDLVEQRGLQRFEGRVYLTFGNRVIPWTQPIRAGRPLVRRAFDAANKLGDLTFAAFSLDNLITNLLASGDALGDVQREAEAGLDFARQARFRLVIDRITPQLQLVRTLRGLTSVFGCFDEASFDEGQFERHLEGDPRLAIAACWYWIRKLQARFFAGAYASAIAAAANAERLLWTSPSFFEVAEYHLYAALTRAALCDAALSAERDRHLEALATHHRRLQEWTENCPENFANRAALVAAEIARLEGRELDAERLYEQAIRSARANSFVHNEALANEVAASFYRARGFETISHAYLRNARYGYLRWGADGKVRQLEELYPHLREDEPAPGPTSTIGASVERLDLATVINVSQAVSGEIVLDKLLDTLMRTAIEQAGAERGLLILPRGVEPRIAAEATTGGDAVTVHLRDQPVSAAVLPESVLHYVLRTQESVILDDAAAQPPFAADPYIRQRQAHSILGLPLLNQAKLIGVLYLENNLSPRVFVPARIPVLKLLASQAAISLENTRLYRDLAEREAKIRRLVEADIIGIFLWDFDGRILEGNDAFLRMVGYDREDLVSGRLRLTDLTPPEWHERDAQWVEEHKKTGLRRPIEKEFFRKDGSRVPILLGAATFEEGGNQGVAFVLDLTERKRAEEALRESEERFRTLVQFSFDVYWETDAQHRFIRQEFDEGAADAPTKGSEIGKTRWQVPYLEPDAEAWRKHRETLDAHLPFRDFELARPTPDGGRRYVSVSGLPVFDRTGRFIGYRGVARHITERKQAEEALRESEARFRTFVDHATDAFMLHAEDGTVLDVNRHACESLGYSRDELIGMTTLDFDPDVNAAILQRYRERLKAGETLTFETHHRRKDGTVFPVEARVREFQQGGQRLIISLTRDITERKRAAEALREMQMELAHVNRVATMGQLTASIAHEINQPIAAALTNAQAGLRWLGAQPPDLDEVRQAFGRIIESTGRAGDVIGRIRYLIRKAPPRKDQLNINEAILDVVALTRSEALKHSVSLHTQLATVLPCVEGDRVQLQQVILNLVMNAVEAMSSLDDEAREVRISTEMDASGGVLVTVRDWGPGLDLKYMDRLFEAFYTTKPNGMGMGLAICRSIIEAHGGRLWASANEPRGAVFQFTIRADQDETTPAEHTGEMPMV